MPAPAGSTDEIYHVSPHAQATANYDYLIPAAPRILIPPPLTTAVRDGNFTSSNPANNSDESNHGSNGVHEQPSSGNNSSSSSNLLNPLPSTAFLSDIDYHEIIRHNSTLEWSYERRRQAQMILPYLYLGPMGVARDEEWLAREGITCLIGVRQSSTTTTGNKNSSRVFNNGIEGGMNGKGAATGPAGAGAGAGAATTKPAVESRYMAGAQRAAHNLGLEITFFDLATNQDLIHAFPSTTAAIIDHLTRTLRPASIPFSSPPPEGAPAAAGATAKTGKVLVFCESGNERSAGVVAAYLMETHAELDFVKAVQICQAKRFCVNFDDGMKSLLQSYGDIVRARRAVAAGASTVNENGNGGGGAGFGILASSTGEGGGGGSGEGEVMDVGAGSAFAASHVMKNKKRALERGCEDEDGDEYMEGSEMDDLERFGGRRQWTPFVDYPGR